MYVKKRTPPHILRYWERNVKEMYWQLVKPAGGKCPFYNALHLGTPNTGDLKKNMALLKEYITYWNQTLLPGSIRWKGGQLCPLS